MDNKISIIKRNIDIADRSSYLARSIVHGQAEELARLCSGKRLSEAQVGKIFCSAFSAPFLSEGFLKFCLYLAKFDSVENIQYSDLRKDNATVSYLKNNYSGEAYKRFSSFIAAEPEPVSDFNSVCESVYSGSSSYAIVPLFNTNDGLMVSLYRMIQRYELKAVLSSDVMMGDGTTETKFMLFSKRLHPRSDFNRMLVSFTNDIDSSLPGLLHACAPFGIKFKFINTLPLEYTDDRREVILDIELGDFNKNAFSLFLKTALPDINIIGMYKTVK